MEPGKPMDIVNKLRRGSLDSNMSRRDSLESNASLDNSSSRPSSFEAGKSLDEARMQVFKANRAKRVWDLQGVDPSTAVFSA